MPRARKMPKEAEGRGRTVMGANYVHDQLQHQATHAQTTGQQGAATTARSAQQNQYVSQGTSHQSTTNSRSLTTSQQPRPSQAAASSTAAATAADIQAMMQQMAINRESMDQHNRNVSHRGQRLDISTIIR